MTITAAIVVFAVLWFLTLLVALPIRVTSQAEDGHVVPGTPASAPSNPMIRRKMFWSTIVAAILWAIICSIILWGGITLQDIDFYGRLN
jgi:predicted secreted protein